jgi:hypothetical protein
MMRVVAALISRLRHTVRRFAKPQGGVSNSEIVFDAGLRQREQLKRPAFLRSAGDLS